MSNREVLLSELGTLVAKHAAWLDGRTWQHLTQVIACGYFEPDDLMSFAEVMREAKPPLKAVPNGELV